VKDEFKIGQRVLKPGKPPYVVAEIGVNHNGDLQLARQTIDAAARAGADAVKFQTFHAEEFMADRDLVYEYESGGRTVRESMYEMFKRLELPVAWHEELRDYARAQGLDFFSSASDTAAVDLLLDLGVPVLKIASEDLINLPLVRYITHKRVPVVLSTGMADEAEIDQAVSLLRDGGCKDLLLLHCVSLYPVPDGEANLLRMVSLREKYGAPVGYSDHTLGIEAATGAAALGAVFIEKHFTLDRALPGPDHALSSAPAELAALVASVRKVAQQRGSPDLKPSRGELAARRDFRRSVVAAVDIPEGAILTHEMLALKRPGTGIAPRQLEELVGKRALRAFRADEQLEWDSLE
jgi:N,N'-diacetyllegionaminate synthase